MLQTKSIPRIGQGMLALGYQVWWGWDLGCCIVVHSSILFLNTIILARSCIHTHLHLSSHPISRLIPTKVDNSTILLRQCLTIVDGTRSWLTRAYLANPHNQPLCNSWLHIHTIGLQNCYVMLINGECHTCEAPFMAHTLTCTQRSTTMLRCRLKRWETHWCW